MLSNSVVFAPKQILTKRREAEAASKGSLKVLAIGNSFSVDAFRYLF